MCQLIETIKCKNANLFNLKWHNIRFNHARKLCFGKTDTLDLSEIISVPEKANTGLFRCRVTYSEKVEEIKFIPHRFRKIESLKLIYDDSINYSLKYSDRKKLNNLFAKRGSCDDILIVKNGLITDTSIANIVFFDGEKWWTPDTPLLQGTQRAKLLAEKKILECRISLSDLKRFEKAGLINAMWNLKNMPLINLNDVQ